MGPDVFYDEEEWHSESEDKYSEERSSHIIYGLYKMKMRERELIKVVWDYTNDTDVAGDNNCQHSTQPRQNRYLVCVSVFLQIYKIIKTSSRLKRATWSNLS